MLQGKRILFVDGDEGLSENFLKALQEVGAAANGVKTAEDALAILEHERFDLVVLDLHLPGMNAYQLCRALEKSPRHAGIPVVPAAVNPFVNSMNIAICSNVVDFLRKPFSSNELVTHLERVLNGNQGAFVCRFKP